MKNEAQNQNSMEYSPLEAMQLAIKTAKSGWHQARPNPCVGAVAFSNGKLLAKAHSFSSGGAHAEAQLIKKLKKIPNLDSKTVDFYVTLEPCAHVGKNPSCASLVLEYNPKKVWVALVDDNPLVAGQGIQRIKDAGIEVDVGLCRSEVTNLYAGFFHFIKTGRPKIVAKLARSLQGAVARQNKQGEKIKQVITGQEVRDWVGNLRSRCDAVVVGGSTLKVDKPSLNTRFSSETNFLNEPSVVVFSREMSVEHFESINDSGLLGIRNILCSGKVLGAEKNDHVKSFLIGSKNAEEAWKQTLDKMGELGFHEVLVECGPQMLEVLLDFGLWDEFHIFTAPVNFEGGLLHAPIGNRLSAFGECLHSGMIGQDFHQVWKSVRK
jgi:diaminohydroxyphosphoribosylaminopyrimidine deaminase / 5-amino-6-(5-phosphoribosylamino)uracil reductase